jgi:2-phosphosulfolactate phosphatase
VNAFEQSGFAARMDWGVAGLRTLEPDVGLLVIVDVLSFTTAVEVATSRGARVYPYPMRDRSAIDFAAQHHAVLAINRHEMSAERPYSLSPRSLTRIPHGTSLVLPSPNGSTLTTLAAKTHLIVAGCLRNARAVAKWARVRDTVGVIASGEVRKDGSLRFAIEDLLGAGAILSHFPAEARSPEADVAVAAFQRFADNLPRHLAECASGRELAAMGFADDVTMAAELDVSDSVPILLQGGVYAAEAGYERPHIEPL